MKLIWRYSRMFSLQMSIYFTLEKATLLFWSLKVQPEERGLLTHYGPTPSNPCCCWLGWWRGRRRGRSRTSRSTPCRRPSSPPGFYSSPLRSASRTCRCRTAPDGQKKNPTTRSIRSWRCAQHKHRAPEKETQQHPFWASRLWRSRKRAQAATTAPLFLRAAPFLPPISTGC